MSAFDKVIGYEDIKTELIRFCDVLKKYEKYKKLGVSLPRGILLAGEPGIGKTMMASSFIEESGCKAFLIRKEKPDGEFVKEIRKIFDKAKEETRSIVFLDDMDKFANEDNCHRDAEEYVAVQSCIDDCKESGVFVLATVNDRYCLPDSLTRAGRFDKVIEMEVPKGEDAKKNVKYYLNQKQILGDIDADEISRLLQNRTCAELESVINEAGIYAGFDDREKIEQKDIIKACMRVIFNAPEIVNPITRKHIKETAVHEAGHAIVSEVLEPGSVSLISICGYSGSTEGITIVFKPDEYYGSRLHQEHEVIRKLGGKAAIEMVYGIADIGCRSDLSNAFGVVREFVDDYCSYGFETFEGYEPSGYLLEKRDRMVAQEIDKYYRQAKQIIVENREFLDLIVNELLEKKTLTCKDIKNIHGKIAKNNRSKVI